MRVSVSERVRGDPPRVGSPRPPVLLLFLVLLSTIPPKNASCQWPPWLAKDEAGPVVYPEIVIGPDRLREVEGRNGTACFRIVDRWTPWNSVSSTSVVLPLPADSIDPGGDLFAALGRLGIPEEGRFVISGPMDPADAAVLYWALRIGGRSEPMIFEEGRTAEGEFEPDRPSPGRGELDTTLVAGADWVREKFGTEGVEILDVRDSTAWRAGHVPHALPFDPRIVIGSDGSFMEGEEIRAILARLGPRPSTTVDLGSEFVVYDEGNCREAALAALVLRLGGIGKVRIFPGGWKEWNEDPASPVVRIVTADEVENRTGGLGEEGGRDDVLVIDVRIHRDHGIRSIPGSVCIPSHLFVDSLSAVTERLRPGRERADLTLVLYCYGSDCIRSRQCATWAARAGFRDLWWFLGGLPEWWGSGRETRTDR